MDKTLELRRLTQYIMIHQSTYHLEGRLGEGLDSRLFYLRDDDQILHIRTYLTRILTYFTFQYVCIEHTMKNGRP